MDTARTAAATGAAACLALFGLLALPYLLFGAGEVGVYYGAGPLSPAGVALFAGVALVALASAAAGRTDVPLVAGLAVVVGVAAAAITLPWALAAGSVVGGLPTSAAFDYHRWAVVAAALLLLAAAATLSLSAFDPKGP